MTELSHFTAIDRTTLTRIADQLVAAGQVERQTTAHDRRQVLLDLTPQGRAAYLKALGVVFEFNRRILDGIPDEAHRAAARTLKQVVENLAPDALARDSIIHFNREALVTAPRPSKPAAPAAASPRRAPKLAS